MNRFGRRPVWRASVLAVALLVSLGLVGLSRRGPGLTLGSYPVQAVDHLEATGRLGPGHRIAAVDVVGCYLLWRAGPATKVFIDDRYDMYPASVAADVAVLMGGRSDAGPVLDRRQVDTVVWAVNQALPGELRTLGGWRQDWNDGTWVVLVRDPGPSASAAP